MEGAVLKFAVVCLTAVLLTAGVTYYLTARMFSQVEGEIPEVQQEGVYNVSVEFRIRTTKEAYIVNETVGIILSLTNRGDVPVHLSNITLDLNGVCNEMNVIFVVYDPDGEKTVLRQEKDLTGPPERLEPNHTLYFGAALGEYVPDEDVRRPYFPQKYGEYTVYAIYRSEADNETGINIRGVFVSEPVKFRIVPGTLSLRISTNKTNYSAGEDINVTYTIINNASVPVFATLPWIHLSDVVVCKIITPLNETKYASWGPFATMPLVCIKIEANSSFSVTEQIGTAGYGKFNCSGRYVIQFWYESRSSAVDGIIAPVPEDLSGIGVVEIYHAGGWEGKIYSNEVVIYVDVQQ